MRVGSVWIVGKKAQHENCKETKLTSASMPASKLIFMAIGRPGRLASPEPPQKKLCVTQSLYELKCGTKLGVTRDVIDY